MAFVLIGKDDPDIRAAIEMIFSRAAHRVLVADDGTTTLEMVRALKPDLLVMDVSMPGATGIDVCRALRTDPPAPYLPILMVSAWTSCDAVRSGWGVGADDYVVKPFVNSDLLSRGEALLSVSARQARRRGWSV